MNVVIRSGRAVPETVARRMRLVVWAVLAVLPGVACTASYPAAPTSTPVVLEVHYGRPMGWVLANSVESFVSFKAYLVDSDGGYENVTNHAEWSSSDASVAQAGASGGFFSAVGPGTADIRASHAGLTGSVALVVQAQPPSFPYLRIDAGSPGTLPLSAARLGVSLHESPQAARSVTAAAAWSSTNPAVATVDGGRVTGHAPGTVEITASYQGGSAWVRVSIEPRRQ